MKLKKRPKKKSKGKYERIRNFGSLVLSNNKKQKTIQFNYIEGTPARPYSILTYNETKDLINELGIILN